MEKILSEYECIPNITFTAQNIYDRMSNIGNKFVNGTNVEITNIKINEIKTTLVENNTDLFELSQSDKINVWSNFSSKIPDYTFDTLSFNNPTIGQLEFFAGYNHNAIKPGIESSDVSDGETIEQNPCCTYDWSLSINFYIILGEFNYDLPNNTGKVRVVFKKSSNNSIIGTSNGIPYSDFEKIDEKTVKSKYTSSINLSGTSSGETEYYGQIQFYDDSGTEEIIYLSIHKDYSFTFTINVVPEGVNISNNIILQNFDSGDEVYQYSNPYIECDTTVGVRDLAVKNSSGNYINTLVDIYGTWNGTNWENLESDVNIGNPADWAGNYTTSPQCGQFSTYAIKLVKL